MTFERWHQDEDWTDAERSHIDAYAGRLYVCEHDGEPLLYCAEGAQLMVAFKATLRDRRLVESPSDERTTDG